MKSADYLADVAKAEKMGADAFHRGIIAAPACDVNFSYFVKKYSTADWRFTKHLTNLMTVWSRAWHRENLK